MKRHSSHATEPHDHSHHGHGDSEQKLRVALGITVVTMLVEFVGSYYSGSLALIADAGHMLTDVLALALAYSAAKFASRARDSRRTFGYRRVEVLAALANAVALGGVSVSIVFHSVERWQNPQPISAAIMGGVGFIGLLGNVAGMFLLRSHHHDINVKAAFWHVVGDLVSSIGVVAASLVVMLTGWARIDSLVSLGISVVIFAGAWRLLREVVDILLEAAPPHIDTEAVRQALGKIDGVADVHDLHIWTIGSGMPALSAHVVLAPGTTQSPSILQKIQGSLRDTWHIHHSTVQIEQRDAPDCGGCT